MWGGLLGSKFRFPENVFLGSASLKKTCVCFVTCNSAAFRTENCVKKCWPISILQLPPSTPLLPQQQFSSWFVTFERTVHIKMTVQILRTFSDPRVEFYRRFGRKEEFVIGCTDGRFSQNIPIIHIACFICWHCVRRIAKARIMSDAKAHIPIHISTSVFKIATLILFEVFSAFELSGFCCGQNVLSCLVKIKCFSWVHYLLIGKSVEPYVVE